MLLNKPQKYCIILFAVIACILAIFCKIDTHIAGYFYKTGQGFYLKNNEIVVMCFRLVPIITTLFGVFCFLYLIYIKYEGKPILKSYVLYLLMAVILGPGLTVNGLLKEHCGRARPCQILEFGGDKAFTCPMRITNECESNCSFTSGHAAMGYYFTSLSYVVPPPYQGIIFIVGILLGSLIGVGRMIQGGHFLSDVIFSGLIIITINHLCFLIWQKIAKVPKTKKPSGKRRK